MRPALPDHLPILDRRGAPPLVAGAYVEREVLAATDLCEAAGRLSPAAVGWSRRPLVRANLHGRWPRKKRWNFWNWISPRFVFSVTLADIDVAAFCQATFIDFATGRSLAAMALARPGSLDLPEHVERTVAFRGRSMTYVNRNDGGDMTVHFAGTARSGERIGADFVVRRPPGQESLNIVVPWSADHFQLNSKHNTMPCEGVVTVGEQRYAMDPADCHAVQDFGRGIWPYRSCWNWGVATGVQDGVRVGVNVGARWTTGTGVNENGILIDGRLHKVMEDLRWEYHPGDWMRPWRVRAEHSGAIDLVLEPIFAHRVRASLGIVRSGGVCCFGRWRGSIRVDDRTRPIRELIGWAEEFDHRW
ncbi:DUF2804 domain-containing protein [bacterium]|nr:DUF2804 domain-containing protein [bacterium]